MNYLNYEFLDEFKTLDNLCIDIYGRSADNKLGVTLYLEDMDNKRFLGSYRIVGWLEDYHNLRRIRHIRNELVHSRTSLSISMATEEDIDFVRSFRVRILNQTDPISQLSKKMAPPQYTEPQPTPPRNTKPQQTDTTRGASRPPYGCLPFVASFLIVVVLFILFCIK